MAMSMQTAVVVINSCNPETTDQAFNAVTSDNTVLVFNCNETDYIEPLLSALRAAYGAFHTVSFVTNSTVIHTELSRFFPELFRGIRFIDQLPLPLTKTDMTQLMSVAMPLPPFELMPAEPLVSTEFNQLKNFFLLDERLTDIAEHESISQLTDAFLAAVSAQHCAFSAFVQIRLLSFYSDKINKYGDVYFKSLSLKCVDENVSSEQLWLMVSDPRFSLNERYFIYNQILSMEFGGLLKVRSDFNRRHKAFLSLVNGFASTFGNIGSLINKNDRNSSIVFVFIAQFLSPRHAPSKIALDIIKYLCSSAQKQVVLVDTCELLPRLGALPWYDAVIGNRGHFEAETLTYEGASFNYLQLSAGMPNLTEIKAIIDLIKNYKPYFCITVGESITADICNKLIPNIVVPTVAVLPHATSRFRVLGERYSIDGYSPEEAPQVFQEGIITGNVLASISPPQSEICREQIGLPLNKFIFALVGNRLDIEIDERFIELICNAFDDDMFLVFIGDFNNYPEFCKKIPKLEKYSLALGYKEDLASVIKLINVYINPDRIGGGTSALYALGAGKPIVSYSRGDVAAISGENFLVSTDFEYLERIVKLKKEKEFYIEQSKHALDIFKIKNDADSIKNILSQVIESEIF